MLFSSLRLTTLKHFLQMFSSDNPLITLAIDGASFSALMVQPHITYPSRSSGSVKAILPFICLLLVIVFWAIVCLLSRQPDALTLPLFLGLSGGMMLCSIGILWHYYKLNRSIPFRWILLSAIILRLISLIGEP